jgi:hypothetical protein
MRIECAHAWGSDVWLDGSGTLMAAPSEVVQSVLTPSEVEQESSAPSELARRGRLRFGILLRVV